MCTLNDIVRTRKVRYVGYCSLTAWHTMKALAYTDANGLIRFLSAQMYYSIAGRDIEREVVPLAQDLGTGHPVMEPAGGWVALG